MARRNDIDWEAIERDYRLGILTLKQICDKYKISDSQLRAKAKGNPEKGIPAWERDLSKDVRTAAKAKVLRITREQAEADLKKTVQESAQESAEKSAVSTLSAVDVASEAQALIEIRQRGRLTELSQVFDNIMSTLKVVAAEPLVLRDLADKVHADDPDAKKDLYKAVSLPMIVDTAKKAVELNSKLQNDERVAFNITEGSGSGADVEAAVRAIEQAQAERQI